MRICSLCKKEKDTSQFYTYKGCTKCKSCDNKNKVLRDVELKLKAISYKGGKCTRCGYDSHYAAFVFHHIGKKEMTWNKMRNTGWAKVRIELDNCQLLCANCHHIIHSKNLG